MYLINCFFGLRVTTMDRVLSIGKTADQSKNLPPLILHKKSVIPQRKSRLLLDAYPT